MEYQIEDSLRFFGSSLPKEEQDRLKEFMTIKNKIVKNQMDRKMLQEKKAKELLKKNRISNKRDNLMRKDWWRIGQINRKKKLVGNNKKEKTIWKTSETNINWISSLPGTIIGSSAFQQSVNS